MCPRLSKRRRSGSSNSPWRSCHQSSFVTKISHFCKLRFARTVPLSCTRFSPSLESSIRSGTRDNRSNPVARLQKAVCLENEVFVILIPRSVVSIGIEDQLGIGHVLN